MSHQSTNPVRSLKTETEKTRRYACPNCGKLFLRNVINVYSSPPCCSRTCRGQLIVADRSARFWEKVNKTDGCWLWTAATLQPQGYGMATFGNGMRLAHRVAWMLTYGDIPDGLQVCHACDNPPCVRPDHLFLGTQLDNVQDMDAKGRRRTVVPRGEKSPHARLTAQQVLDVRKRYAAGGVTMQALADEFGIAKTNIGCLIRGKTWKHLPL